MSSTYTARFIGGSHDGEIQDRTWPSPPPFPRVDLPGPDGGKETYLRSGYDPHDDVWIYRLESDVPEEERRAAHDVAWIQFGNLLGGES